MDVNVNLRGKTAIITGSNSGIGLGIAKVLAQNGADIVLNSFTNNKEDHELAAQISSEHQVKCLYIAGDMSNGASTRQWVIDAHLAMGRIDILVNNAGIQHVAPIDEFPSDKYDQIIAINLNSNFHTIAAALPFMRAQKWGRIINIASAHGLSASPYKSAYVAAKHGVLGLTKVTALETAGQNITANAICPGYVLTPLVEAQIPDTMNEYQMSREDVIAKIMLARQPSKQFVSVEEIGGTVAFLCSMSAAQVTGASISVDGGWSVL